MIRQSDRDRGRLRGCPGRTADVQPATPDINGVGCDANGCLAPLPPALPVTGYGVRMQTTGSKSSTGPALAGYTAPNKWLKLTRSGSTFTSYESTDGVTLDPDRRADGAR